MEKHTAVSIQFCYTLYASFPLTKTISDIVNWPGSSRLKYPPLLNSSAPDVRDLRSRLKEDMKIICPKSTCNQTLCFAHSGCSLWHCGVSTSSSDN